MTDAARELMNFAYWHVWGNWLGAIFLGLGVASGFGLINIFGHICSWRKMIKFMLMGFVIATVLYFLWDYIYFVHTWKDIVIEGNY